MNVSPYSNSALKRGAAYFLIGRAASALLTFITLLWIVRLLSVEEYGVYVILIAGMEIALHITSMGLPWVAARYFPEFRLYASGKILAHFVWQFIAQVSLFLVVGALLILIAMSWLQLPSELVQYVDVIRLYILVFVLEGLGRRIREDILGAFFQQRQAQISLLMRNLSLFLLLLYFESIQGKVYLYHVVLVELVASSIAVLLALAGLMQYLYIQRNLLGQDDWESPSWLGMWRIARQMYLSNLITLAYNPQVFVFMVQHYLGMEATALFGFLRSLYGQVSNYLPATLLFSLIRPKLVASYLSSGGMTELTRNANLAGKISLFTLMPVLVFTWIAGDELLNLLSGGRFNDANYCLAGLLLALVPLSQCQILTTIAVTIDKSHLCSRASFLGALALPLAYWLLELDQGLWSVIIAVIMSHILFNATLITALTLTTSYRFDVVGLIKLSVAALVGFVLVQQLAITKHGWSGLFIMAILILCLFMLSTYFIKPFQAEERVRLYRVFNRKFFA